MKRPFPYLLGRMIAGRFRIIRKNPSQIILFVLIIAFIVLMFIVSSKDQDRRAWVDVPTRGSILTAFCLFCGYLTIRNGLKKGSTFFRMADVNLVFPSPLSHKSVLIYGFSRQFGISLLIMAWLGFQTINLKGLFGISGIDFIPFFLGVFLIVCYMPVVSMVIYGRLLRTPQHRQWLARSLNLIVGAIGLAAVIILVITTDPVKTMHLLLDQPFIRYIPILGWIRELLSASYLGWSAWTWTALGLSSVGFALLVMYMLRSDLDFYEDVLLVTEQKERVIKQKKEGQSPFHTYSGKVRRVKQVYRGYGASSLFYRHLLEYRKTGFLLFDKSTLFIGLVAVVAGYLLRNNPMGIYFLLYISLYMLFFLSFAGKWEQELTRPYIFLLPGRPMVKIWYATAAVHMKHLFEGLLLFLIAGGLFGTPVVSSLLLALCFTGFGALYLYTGILFYRLVGRISDTILMRVVLFMLILVIAAPAVTALIIGAVKFADSLPMQWLFMSGVVVYSAVIAFLAMLSGRRVFTEMDIVV